MLRMKKRYKLINFICLLAVYKKLIGTGRVLSTRILRYDACKLQFYCKNMIKVRV